jgi:multidrug efflux pump subunit AcrA (membrane-fusion protein)
MNRPGSILLTLALAGAGLLTLAPAFAHEGHHHTAMGTVEAVEAAELDLETRDGKVETFVLTDTTAYRRADVATARADIEVGERAVVMYETKNGRNLAIEVKVGAKKTEGQAAADLWKSASDGRG